MNDASVECDIPASRNFGILFSAIFLFLFFYSGYKGYSSNKTYGWFAACLAVGLVAIAAPRLLNPFYRVWMKLGDLMGKVVSPLVLGTIFFMLITPIALFSRLFGRDELRIKRANVNSYWIDRVPPGPAGYSFKNQF